MEYNQEMLQLKPSSRRFHCWDSLDPHANVWAQTIVKTLKSEDQKIPETNGAMSKKKKTKRREVTDVSVGSSYSPGCGQIVAVTEESVG